MAELFADVVVDRAVCSGLPRTREIGTTLPGDHVLELGVVADSAEIQPMTGKAPRSYDVLADIAYSHWCADDRDPRFLGGERYDKIYERVSRAMQALLDAAARRNLTVFAHAGTNAAVPGWAAGIGLKAFGLIDQATC
jgi:probable phosphoglycerate mutase